MKKLLSLSIIFIISLLLNACVTQQQVPPAQDKAFANNSIVLGKWVHLGPDMNVASTIEFTTSDFTDESGNTRPFRIDENNHLFIQGANNVESEVPFTINGDHLTFNGIEYIKANSSTYDQKIQDHQNSQSWDAQVASITQQLQSTYNDANNRINQGVFNFINGNWLGSGYGDSYSFFFGGASGSGKFSMRVNPGSPNARAFDGCFVLNPTTYKISPFVSYGKINNDFYIGYQDTNKLNQVKDNINYMANLTFENFIRNSTLYLPSNSELNKLGNTNTILVKNCGNDNNPAKIVINNLNTDTNEMIITNGPGMRDEGRSIQLHR